MVTSNQQPDKKVVKMEEQNNSVLLPQRTLLREVNEHLTCPLCRGYFIDATTIVECFHSFCRSCIVKHLKAKSYCPVCEMMINSAKPNFKLDKALQDIVYKLVPGLFQKEMERRQQFYASRPGPAACTTPEQRGEDTERIIFSPEDVISFSLEYCDVTDAESISSKSSDSNESQQISTTARRFLQCPAVVNISHLKKFLGMKFDIDSKQFSINILYKRVPLPDYYTLMDIAYIYNWKRNKPMRFFYQIIDYVAIRNRIFDINHKSVCLCHDEGKTTQARTDDTSVISPAPHFNEQGSEVSSGSDSPMLDEKQTNHSLNIKKVEEINKDYKENKLLSKTLILPKKCNEEVEKSQFLNSFELTAKNNCLSPKKSALKSEQILSTSDQAKNQTSSPHVEQRAEVTSKRKYETVPNTPEPKKLRVETEIAKIAGIAQSTLVMTGLTSDNTRNEKQSTKKTNESEDSLNKFTFKLPTPKVAKPDSTRDNKQATPHRLEAPCVKLVANKPSENQAIIQQPPVQRTVSPLKFPIHKQDMPMPDCKTLETQKPVPPIKMPNLKPGVPLSQSSQNKVQTVNRIRMDLLANNSDFTKLKTTPCSPTTSQSSGESLKSLFDSCKFNIPSSLSITLTDQKQELHNSAQESIPVDPKKNVVNRNMVSFNKTAQHKVPSPPVHNYIEILKLPDTETKKSNKGEGSIDSKLSQPSVADMNTVQCIKPPTKASEGSAKGPIPNLKPIADTKQLKQTNISNCAAPATFQQTFEQQLQTLQTDKKAKGPKNKAQVPNLVPTSPKSLNVANQPVASLNKSTTMPLLKNKPSTALDLSTPHNIQNQLLIMQSIDNLAKKQTLPNKSVPLPATNAFPGSYRPLPTGISPLRIPYVPHHINSIKSDKISPSGSSINNRYDLSNSKSPSIRPAISPSILSSGYPVAPHTSCSTSQTSLGTLNESSQASTKGELKETD